MDRALLWLLLFALAWKGGKACELGCVPTFGKCAGRGVTSALGCCNPADRCVQKNDHYAQCRPIGEHVPGWPASENKILACGAKLQGAKESGRPKRPPRAGSLVVAPEFGSDEVGGLAAAPEATAEPPAASEHTPGPAAAAVADETAAEKGKCNDVYMQDAATECGATCMLPGDSQKVASAAACLTACNKVDDCHCALHDSEAGTCTMVWAPCDSAALALTPSRSNAPSNMTALQPCLSEPVAVVHTSKKPTSAYAACKPMAVHHGLLILDHACDAPACVQVPAAPTVADLDGCIAMCIAAGFSVCKAVQFKPGGSFGLKANECTMYNSLVEDLGVHATAQVLATDGLGATVASYCSPPNGHDKFPVVDKPFDGVDWEAACSGTDMALVPDMRMGCASCAFIPASRAARGHGNDLDELHYESKSLEECEADCAVDEACGCAFFRIHEDPGQAPAGWCLLSTAECAHAVVGAQVDHTRVRTAISKCSYNAPKVVKAKWPATTQEAMDWFGVWEEPCEYKEPFTYENRSSRCGPNCVAPGTYTSLEKSTEACAKRCSSVVGCACSYFQAATGRCTLMHGSPDAPQDTTAAACRPWDYLPGAMAYEADAPARNDVTMQCTLQLQ